MTASFAKGSKALGICDRCGFTYKLSMLSPQIINRVDSNLLVCPECLDEDHPQLRLGEVDAFDPMVLQNPRPDTGKDASRELTGTQFPDDRFWIDLP
jgi:hypothetical protein